MSRPPAASRARIRALPGRRVHLQDGPIDVVLQAWGEPGAVLLAHRAAAARFMDILDELVSDLPELRRAMADAPRVATPVARRMLAACAPFAGEFITPMAAVAGGVADELMGAMRTAAALDRAFVNDGGDIAVHMTPGCDLTIGLVADVARGMAGALDGAVRLQAGSGVGGVATSGAQGRSFSLGVADAVTALARDAASADAAATMIANAVTVESARVRRAPASTLDPDSDLGDRLVTVEVGPLDDEEIDLALSRGLAQARTYRERGLVIDAALSLQGRVVALGPASPLCAPGGSSSRNPRRRLPGPQGDDPTGSGFATTRAPQ